MTPPWDSPGQNAARGASGHTESFRALDDAVPPPGWYPTPTGQQRYWDGSAWLALPLPPDSAHATSHMAGRGSASKDQRAIRWVLGIGAAVLLLGLAGGAIAWKFADNERQEEAAAAAAAESSAAASERAAAEASAEQERQAAAAASSAAAAQDQADDAERASRLGAIPGIEASVQVMAERHAADGIIDGPIIEVTCSPVGGGSTDDLTQQTTVFSCFAAYRDNGDGTMSGYPYNATMNWTTGSYTYGLGAP